MFIILTSRPPRLPTKDLPSDGPILVFDATLTGYKKAIERIEKIQGPVFRLVIPYSEHADDVGDYLVRGLTEPVWGVAQIEHSCTRIVPITRDVTVNLTWPWCSTNRIADYQGSILHLESRLLLRDSYSGLSLVQREMLKTRKYGETVVLAMVVAKHGLSQNQARRQWYELSRGNIPIFQHESPGVPNVLLNGPMPIAYPVLVEHITKYIQFGTQPNWDEIPPCCDGYIFENKTSRCVEKNGFVVKLPYNVTKHEFGMANPGCDQSTVEQPVLFHNPTAKTRVDVQWDPVFLDAKYATMNEYMNYWLGETRHRMALRLEQVEEDRAFDITKREFIRTVLYKKFESVNGRTERCFLDENLAQKRRRIDRKSVV